MQSNDGERRRGLWLRAFGALWALLVLAAAVSARPAEAAPFAYVANSHSGTISVIDMASNTAVATITVGSTPFGVAITPDGKHAYVANQSSKTPGTVSVIDTDSNMVVATVPVGGFPHWGSHHPGWEIRLCDELWQSRHCLGDRHGHQHGGGQSDRGGD